MLAAHQAASAPATATALSPGGSLLEGAVLVALLEASRHALCTPATAPRPADATLPPGDPALTAYSLLALASAQVARLPCPPATREAIAAELAHASGWEGLAAGAHQLALLRQPSDAPAPAALHRLHRLVDGVMAATSCRIGGLLAGADAAALSALGLYGERLGLACRARRDLTDPQPGIPALPGLLGQIETLRIVHNHSQAAHQHLSAFGAAATALRDLLTRATAPVELEAALEEVPSIDPEDLRKRVILVDANDRPIGEAGKLEAHRDGGRLHRAFSVLIFDRAGRVLIQRRAARKYHFGGVWANACCGHPAPGEETTASARKRLGEELGFEVPLRPLFTFEYAARDPISGLTERELDHVHVGQFDGTPEPNPDEVDEVRWMSPAELQRDLGRNPAAYSPWFRLIWERLPTPTALPTARSA